MSENASENEVPQEVQDRLADWRWHFKAQQRAHYALGVLGVLASSTAAAYPESASFAGVFSAAIFGVLGFARPDQNYTKFVNAWRLLDAAVDRYRYGLISLPELLDAKERGEQVLAGFEKAAPPSERLVSTAHARIGPVGLPESPEQPIRRIDGSSGASHGDSAGLAR